MTTGKNITREYIQVNYITNIGTFTVLWFKNKETNSRTRQVIYVIYYSQFTIK